MKTFYGLFIFIKEMSWAKKEKERMIRNRLVIEREREGEDEWATRTD